MRSNEDVIVFEGNSLTFLGRFHERMEHLSPNSSVHNVATGGNTIQDIIAQASTEVDSLFDPAGTNRLFLWIGANNMLDGSTATPREVLDLVWGYVADRKALGWDVTISTLPQSDGLGDTEKFIEYNALIRAEWHLHADELVDIGADLRFQDATDLTYFDVDGLHLSWTGNEAVADILDALYVPQPSSQTLNYADLGAFELIEQGGQARFLSLQSFYGNGDEVGGIINFDADGTMNRITFNDFGNFEIADWDGDGDSEILSINGAYRSGFELNGAVFYELDGSISRYSFHQLGEFRIGDWEGDGQLDIISTQASYASGVALNGTVRFGADGNLERLNYFNPGDSFELVDFNGDGKLEIFSTSAAYGNGAEISGAVVIGHEGELERFSFDRIGDYQAADIDGDGQTELVSTNDFYASGSARGGMSLYESDGSYTRISFYEMDEFQLHDFDNDGALELITGSARLGSWAPGGLVMFELVGEDTYQFQRLAFGDFDHYRVADINNDGFLDVVNQTDNGLVAHYFLQANLI